LLIYPDYSVFSEYSGGRVTIFYHRENGIIVKIVLFLLDGLIWEKWRTQRNKRWNDEAMASFWDSSRWRSVA
jgi:hypothetical protein